MTYNGSEYFYLTNVQGDVTGLADASGATVVNYTYDSWGKLISTTGTMATTLGVNNPYRYRGYRHDTETGFYYLQSRYYNPEIGRFINSDNERLLLSTIDELTDKNLFSYCDNNPISRTDDSGERWNWSKIFTTVAVVAAVVSVVALTVASAGTMGMVVLGGKLAIGGASKAALIASSIAYKSAIVSVSSSFIDLNIRRFAKGGKQKINDSSLIGIPDSEISRRLKDPRTPNSEKQKLKKEQKARGNRNRQKRNER